MDAAAIIKKVESFAPGGAFYSKASQKDALWWVADQYASAKDKHFAAALRANQMNGDVYSHLNDVQDLSPMELHHWKPKHEAALMAAASKVTPGAAREAFIASTEEFCSLASLLKDLRDEIKETPVEKVPRKVRPVSERAVRETVAAMHKRLNAIYLDNLDLGEELYKRFGRKLGVYVSSHLVTNSYGTTFIRSVYYLEGKRQPLSLIAATLEKMGATFGDEYFGGWTG